MAAEPLEADGPTASRGPAGHDCDATAGSGVPLLQSSTPPTMKPTGRLRERGKRMVATRWSIRGLSMGTVGVLLALTCGPAMADSKVFDDPVGDSTSVDISQVRVVHRDSVTVRVRSVVPLAPGQVYAFWIDAGHGLRPNYHVSFRANAGFDDVLGLVRSFGDRPSRFVDCPGLRVVPTSSMTSRCRSGSRDDAWTIHGESGSPYGSRTRPWTPWTGLRIAEPSGPGSSGSACTERGGSRP